MTRARKTDCDHPWKRTFGGKQYKTILETGSKAEAKKEAKQHRDVGRKARIAVKKCSAHRNRYAVYIRTKK